MHATTKGEDEDTNTPQVDSTTTQEYTEQQEGGENNQEETEDNLSANTEGTPTSV